MFFFIVSKLFPSTSIVPCMISGFRYKVDGNYNLLGYCAVSGANSLLALQYNLLLRSSRVKNLDL